MLLRRIAIVNSLWWHALTAGIFQEGAAAAARGRSSGLRFGPTSCLCNAVACGRPTTACSIRTLETVYDPV